MTKWLWPKFVISLSLGTGVGSDIDGGTGEANETEDDNCCGIKRKRLPHFSEAAFGRNPPTPDGDDVLDSVYVPSLICALALLIDQQDPSNSLLFPRWWAQVSAFAIVITRHGEATWTVHMVKRDCQVYALAPPVLRGLQLSQQPHGEDLGAKGEPHPMGMTLNSDDGGQEVAGG